MASVISQQGGAVGVGTNINVAMYAWLLGQYGINNIKYNVVSVAGGSMTLGQFAKAFWDANSPNLQQLLCTETSLIGAKVSQLPTVPPLGTKPLPGVVEDTITGISSGITSPKQAAVIVTWQTLVGGPAGRGRLYLPFIPVSELAAGGQISAAYQTSAATYVAGLRTTTAYTVGGVTVTVTPVIHHRSSGLNTSVTGAVVQPKIGNQRRRGDYGRTNPDSI